MAFQKLKEAYSRFKGEPDERIVAESNRIYRTGFWLFAIGYLVYRWHGWMLAQVAYVNDLVPTFDVAPYVDPFLQTGFFFVFAVVIVMLCYKGIFSASGLGDEDVFPAAACLGAAGVGAFGMFVLATFMRALAEFELMGLSGVNMFDDVLIAVIFAVQVFVLVLVACSVTFYVAKRRRKRLEANFDD